MVTNVNLKKCFVVLIIFPDAILLLCGKYLLDSLDEGRGVVFAIKIEDNF